MNKMSSYGIGLGSSKKGRTADSSMVTRNIKIVAQGESDATYANQQKKNPFRLSTAVLNEEAYNSQVLGRRNMQNAMATNSESNLPPPLPIVITVDLFSPFSIGDWQFNYSSFVGSPSPRIQIMPDPAHPGSPRTSSFYTKSQIDLTRSFDLSARFVTKITPGSPPLDGFTVAISADPLAYGGNGGGLGISGGGNTVPVVGIALKPFVSNTTYLLTANTTGSPSGSPVTMNFIGSDITDIDDLVIDVSINYAADTEFLSWTLQSHPPGIGAAVNTYTNVNLSTLLGVANGYIGCSAGAGAKIQPVFLTGMTYIQ